jgi:hypothetical protein
VATIQEALDVVKANSTRTGSLIALFDAKKAELEAALANQMTPEIQAAIDEVFTVETADATAMDAALNTNVPPPTDPPVDPNAPLMSGRRR